MLQCANAYSLQQMRYNQAALLGYPLELLNQSFHHMALPHGVKEPLFMFAQRDLDMVLYGYAKNSSPSAKFPGHALSGLRVGELSHGIDKILSGSSPPTIKKPPTITPIDTSNLSLPPGIELFQSNFAGAYHYGVFCSTPAGISKGTKFGPFTGKTVNTSEIKTNDDNSCMWEVFEEGRLSHFVDGRGTGGNWMAFVNCARYSQEQNLIMIQIDGQIHYEACKDIPQGTELLVWYSEAYVQFMGIPTKLQETLPLSPEIKTQEEEQGSEGFSCERCGKVFAYKYYRDKHLKYTRCVDQGDRKFPCHLCNRSFEKRDRLRIHILHVHEKHRPHKCSVCGKCFSQSSSLNKHMRVHSGERPYKCVYCNKAFTASSILRTHIRQHSGEKPFKCKHCKKAFASHAAHDSHVRRTHAKDREHACALCDKTFSQPYELKFHVRAQHGEESHACPGCGACFPDTQTRDQHLRTRACTQGQDQGQGHGHGQSHVFPESHPSLSGLYRVPAPADPFQT